MVFPSTDYHFETVRNACSDMVRPPCGGGPEGGASLAERSVGVFEYERLDQELWRGGYRMLRHLLVFPLNFAYEAGLLGRGGER